MSITIREFELGFDSRCEELMVPIYNYLSEHIDRAYNLDELSKLVFADSAMSRKVVGFNVRNALDKLVHVGAVREKTIGPLRYYTYSSAMDTESWNNMLSGESVE